MSAELKPNPLGLKRKPEGARIKNLELAEQCTDLVISKCSGTVYGRGVIVVQLQHIWALVKLGCYGKGMFSRSVPSHQCVPSHDKMKQVSRKRKAACVDSEEIELLWKKRMKLHSQWKEEGQGTMTSMATTTNMATITSMAKMTSMATTTSMAKMTSMATTTNMATMTSMETMTSMAETKVECTPTLSVNDDYQQFILRLKAIKKDDPYPLEEYLQLSPEEAFYLAAEAGVLTVESDSEEAGTLTISDLWLHFSSLSMSFCARYAAYSHYRAGNWVPKSGLKFGVDFLLYKESPLSYHSSFAIVVREEGVESEGGKNNLTWKEVIGLDRVSGSARKDLLMCHVTWPEGITKGEPCCVDRATITDILVKRWVPQKDR